MHLILVGNDIKRPQSGYQDFLMLLGGHCFKVCSVDKTRKFFFSLITYIVTSYKSFQFRFKTARFFLCVISLTSFFLLHFENSGSQWYQWNLIHYFLYSIGTNIIHHRLYTQQFQHKSTNIITKNTITAENCFSVCFVLWYILVGIYSQITVLKS